MRLGDEGVMVLEWAYAALCASVALRDAVGDYTGTPLDADALEGHVWPDVAPPRVDPVVVLSVGEGVDVQRIGPHPRLFSGMPLNVRAIGQVENYDALGPMARAIYNALVGNANVPVAHGGLVLTCTRTAVLQYPEDAGSIQYRHLGHLFQVNAQ